MLAGVVFGLLALLAGGAVGPGRMTDVGPLAFSVLVHAITAFGIGGLLGGLAMTWWQRRGMEPVVDAGPEPEPEPGARDGARGHRAASARTTRTPPRPPWPRSPTRTTNREP